MTEVERAARRAGMSRHGRGQVCPAAAGKARKKDALKRVFNARAIGRGDMQTKVFRCRFDPCQTRLIARIDVEKPLVPAQVFGPIEARNAVDGGIGGLAVTSLVPGLKAERGNAKFGSRQGL